MQQQECFLKKHIDFFIKKEWRNGHFISTKDCRTNKRKGMI
ncbi:hypothetical protein BSM4216_3352 [Bacillus smithii]|nr:hypothetical protein BSM4216_3352 [Bacillus smithii]